jgi:hypothetical protein
MAGWTEPAAPTTATLNVQGFRGYFNEHDPDGSFGTTWLHLGYLRNPESGKNIESTDTVTAIDGPEVIIDTTVTKEEVTRGFETISAADANLIALWNGGTVVSATIAGITDPVKSFLNQTESKNGQLILVYPSAKAAGISLVEYFPSFSLTGSTRTIGSGKDNTALKYEGKSLAHPTYTVPAAFMPATPYAKYGFSFLVAKADTQDALAALFPA